MKPIRQKTRREFGRMVREARSRLGLTQAEVASEIGSSRAYIVMIENGQRDARLYQLLELARFLQFDASLVVRSIEHAPVDTDEDAGYRHLAQLARAKS